MGKNNWCGSCDVTRDIALSKQHLAPSQPTTEANEADGARKINVHMQVLGYGKAPVRYFWHQN